MSLVGAVLVMPQGEMEIEVDIVNLECYAVIGLKRHGTPPANCAM